MSDGDRDFGPAEYLCYRLLVELEASRSYPVSGSRFHKLSCITDRHLASERDRDVRFPRHWYVYGEVVDERSLDGDFYIAPSANHWAGRRYLPVEDVHEWEFDVAPDAKDDIDAAVDWTVDTFERTNAEAVGKYQYRHHVPNEFIRTYSDLRTRLKSVDLNEQYTLGDFRVTDRSTRGFVVDSLDAMVDTYPRNDYPEAYELFVEWYDTVELLLEPEDPDYEAVEEFLDSFIAMLARVELRFHHRRHIPDARIRVWEDERLEAKETFARTLAEKRADLLDERGPARTVDPARRGDGTASAPVSFSRRLDSFD
ncbi:MULTISPECIES: hypothetical protein [Halorussus]|uniref:hypothetical protein n=1 Tax=Halorussus TaxID=1070314 RepID=UPI000E2137D4|nr:MULTISPECIES: hypothetical protein [Halorussus]NHN61531.1 hypothetical protein [Halorussus sp. JP-T4]